MNPKYFLQGAIVALVTYYINPNVDFKVLLFLSLLSVLLFMAIDHRNNKTFNVEGFDSSSNRVDESRLVRYGDTVTLWPWRNTFIRDNNVEQVEQSGRLQGADDIPRSSYVEYFVLEDPNEPSGAGNSNPIRYGDKVMFRSHFSRYLFPVGNEDSGNVMYKSRVENEDDKKLIVKVESSEPGMSDLVTYGSRLYLKTVNNSYLRALQNNNIGHGPKDNKAKFTIYDKFGQGVLIDWARRGEASQSSMYDNNYSHRYFYTTVSFFI